MFHLIKAVIKIVECISPCVVLIVATIITSASKAVGESSLHECLTFPACTNRTSQHVKLACEAEYAEIFLSDDKNSCLKNNKIKKVVNSSEPFVRINQSHVAKISSVMPMVQQKRNKSAPETEMKHCESTNVLRHKINSVTEMLECLRDDRNEIGIDILWHAFTQVVSLCFVCCGF